MKPKNFIIPIHVYPFDVMVSINENFDSFGKSVTNKWDATILEDFQKYEKINQAGIAYVYTSESHLCAMIKMINFKKDAKGFGALVHEIFHCTEFILRKCGLSLNENSHEAYAYLCGYLTEKIFEKL